MKKGKILFVTEGRDELHDHSDDLRKARAQFDSGVNQIRERGMRW